MGLFASSLPFPQIPIAWCPSNVFGPQRGRSEERGGMCQLIPSPRSLPQFQKLPILTILPGTHTRDTAPYGTPSTSAPGEQPIRQSRKTHCFDNGWGNARGRQTVQLMSTPETQLNIETFATLSMPATCDPMTGCKQASTAACLPVGTIICQSATICRRRAWHSTCSGHHIRAETQRRA